MSQNLTNQHSISKSTTLKNHQAKNLLALFLLFPFLTSCSGGGGDSSSSGGKPESGFRVIHASLSAPALDVFKTAAETSKSVTVKYAEASNYIDTGSGNFAPVLKKANIPSNVSISNQLSIEEGNLYSIVVYERSTTDNLKSFITKDAGDREIIPTKSLVRVINAVQGTSSLDVVLADNQIADNLDLGEVSDYQEVSPGVFEVIFENNDSIFDRDRVNLAPGKAYTIVATGELGYFVTPRLLQD